VTEWFAKDLAAHLLNRAVAESKAVKDGQVPINTAEAQKKNEDYFLQQVKYWMAPKWMDFGGPAAGKGVNTVVLAGHAIRKNQLGNIEFGFIVNALPVPGKGGIAPITAGYVIGGNGTYGKTHPYHENFGEFQGLQRADNLAAFGVGRGIFRDLESKPIWKKIKDLIALGKPIELSDAEGRSLWAFWRRALEIFSAAPPRCKNGQRDTKM